MRHLFKFRKIRQKHHHSYQNPSHETDESERTLFLIQEVQRLNQLLEKNNHIQTNPFRFVFIGMLQGFGTILGATVVVALFVYLLRPFMNLEWLRPYIDQIIQIIQSHAKPG